MTIEEAKELVERYRSMRMAAATHSTLASHLNEDADELRAKLKDAGFEYLLAPPKEKT